MRFRFPATIIIVLFFLAVNENVKTQKILQGQGLNNYQQLANPTAEKYIVHIIQLFVIL